MKSVLAQLETALPVADLLSLPTDGGLQVEPDFSPEDRETLKRRLDLLDIAAPAGVLVIRRWRGKGLSVRGTLTAEIVQACVVTLEPVEQRLDAEIDVMFFPGADPVDMDSEVDPLPADALEIGALMAEHLALAVDAYPRKSGVEFAEIREEAGTASAFEALRALKDRSAS